RSTARNERSKYQDENNKRQALEKLQIPTQYGGIASPFEIANMNGLRCALCQPLKSPGFVAVSLLALGVGANTVRGAQTVDWPRFRGPNGSGISEAHNLPIDLGP